MKNQYLFFKENDYELYKGAMQDVLPTFDVGSIDSIITDPPYELNFMGKGWDNSGVAFQKDTWEHCFRVLKEGGYLLAFGGSRTFHRIACAIEDAGFEIRDTIMWLYGSGFPKSMNIGLAIDKANGVESEVVGVGKSGESKTHTRTMHSETKDGKSVFGGEYEIKKAQNEWQGWGTCLKPAYEPIIVARKPFKCSLVENIMQNGVGGLNIDECRVANTNADSYDLEKRQVSKATGSDNDGHFLDLLHNKDLKHGVTNLGRFPANVILTYDETDYEEVCGGMPTSDTPNESASRYFYCAKASKKDRDEGLELFINIHPTVKPVELMQYLVRLVSPKGATILDCFMGSGSTGKAVMFENRERQANYKFIGVEMTEEYLPICQARIDYAKNKYEYELKKEENVRKEKGLSSIFDFLESE